LSELPLFDLSVLATNTSKWKERLLEGVSAQLHGDRWTQLTQNMLQVSLELVDNFRTVAAVRGPVGDLRLRVACLEHVQCSRFHWDDVPLRAVATLIGPGTEVLPEAAVDREGLENLGRLPIDEQGSMSTEEWNSVVAGGVDPQTKVCGTPEGWAVLLKGSEWATDGGAEDASLGVVHRSPPGSQKRILLQVDYASAVRMLTPPVPEEPPSLEVNEPEAVNTDVMVFVMVAVFALIVTMVMKIDFPFS